MQRRYAGSISVTGLMFILCLLAPPVAQAADYYVARNGANTHTPPYASWETASSNIQNAVNAAAEFDTIWIGSGTYTVPTNAVEHIGTNVVYMDKLLNLIGASGDPADTIIDGEGAYRGMAIVRSRITTTPLVMEALTIRNCFATNWGGGIYVDNGSTAWPCIMRNCVITSNTVSSPVWAYGGGIYAYGNWSAWSLSMSNCVLQGNIATNTFDVDRSRAGAAFLRNTGLKEFVNCIIEDNWAGQAGGLYLEHGTLYAMNTVFRGNQAPRYENAGWGGGAIHASSSQVDLRNCLFVENSSGAPGGAVCFQHQHGYAYTIAMRNCTFVSNYNRAVYIRNWAEGQGYFPALRLWNSVFHANGPEDVMLPPSSAGAPVTNFFTNCCFTSTNFGFNLVGADNIAANPLFMDLDGGDFQLRSGSPCIDTGVNQDWMTGALDLVGNRRINFGVVDMGAYEHQHRGTLLLLR